MTRLTLDEFVTVPRGPGRKRAIARLAFQVVTEALMFGLILAAFLGIVLMAWAALP